MNDEKLTRLTGRAGQRGTALMEALMVNIVLVILLAGVVFFQATYSAKIKSDQNTRAYAWTYALQGCNKVPSDQELAIQSNFGTPGGAVDSSGEGNLQSDLGNTGNSVPNTGSSLDNNTNYTNNVFGTGQGVTGASVGTVKATSSVQMTSYNALKVQGRVMTSETHVQCNNTPASATNAGAVAIQMARDLANW